MAKITVVLVQENSHSKEKKEFHSQTFCTACSPCSWKRRKDKHGFKRHWSGSILKAIYANLTDQCSWQLKFRLRVSLGIGHFLSVRISEITFLNTEIFELCSPDNIKDDSQIPFITLFIHLQSQINSFAKLKLLSATETGEISSFPWIFYACHEHRIYDEHQSGKRSRWITKKKKSINSNKKRFNQRSINFMLSASILLA